MTVKSKNKSNNNDSSNKQKRAVLGYINLTALVRGSDTTRVMRDLDSKQEYGVALYEDNPDHVAIFEAWQAIGDKDINVFLRGYIRANKSESTEQKEGQTLEDIKAAFLADS